MKAHDALADASAAEWTAVGLGLPTALGEALPRQGPSLNRVRLNQSVVHHQISRAALTG